MRRLLRTILAATALALGLVPISALADDPDELIPCRSVVIRPPPAGGRPQSAEGLTKFVCFAPEGESFALPSFVPQAFIISNVPQRFAPPNYKWLTCPDPGLGNPPGSKGYNCHIGGVDEGDVVRVVIKPKVVKAFVKKQFPFDGPDLPYSSDFRVMFIVASSIVGPPFSPGGERKRYCALFGGTIIKNDATVFRAKDAPAPTACSPSGAFLDADRF